MDRDGKGRLLVLLLATAPLSWLMLFGGYALRARVALGRWPLPYHPDPKDLGFHAHHLAVVLGFPVSLALALGACVWAWLPSSGRRSRGWAVSMNALAVLSSGLTIATARANPRHLFTWFLD